MYSISWQKRGGGKEIENKIEGINGGGGGGALLAFIFDVGGIKSKNMYFNVILPGRNFRPH